MRCGVKVLTGSCAGTCTIDVASSPIISNETAQGEDESELKYRKRRPSQLTQLRRGIIGLSIVASAVVVVLQVV